jgi:alanine racemase
MKHNNSYRSTRAEINLSAIEYNFRHVEKCVGKRAKILAVVKADAYGHGAVEVSQRLKKCGVKYFGVATVLEAIELRKNKINSPILLLTVCYGNEFSALINYNITPTIVDLNTAAVLDKKLSKLGKKLPIHVKIDTGMGRIGIWHKDSLEFIMRLSKLKNLILEGIYTHFPSADEDEEFTKLQIASFDRLIDDLKVHGINIPLRHAANSAGIMRYKDAHFSLVRPGLMLYGLYSDKNSQRFINLKPAMSFKTAIAYLKDVPAGRSISYSRTFITTRETRIATLPVGYADGYNRLLSNRAQVLIKGRRCPVIGRVCMDHTMIDVSEVDAKIGDEVVLIGRQGGLEINAEEIAHLCSTISYEVVCWISKRVSRIYIG